MRLSKKAQGEIMGIALVVILMVIGILFMVKYQAKEPGKTQEEFQRRELPKTIITSLVETTSTCNNEKMADVLQDCGFGDTFRCEVEDDILGSCDYLQGKRSVDGGFETEGVLKQIMDTMLVKKFQYNYRVSLLGPEGKDIFDQNGKGVQSDDFTDCFSFDSATQPMMFGLTLELKVCY
jgi:hypothetical protein